jgi:hypothetical protein
VWLGWAGWRITVGPASFHRNGIFQAHHVSAGLATPPHRVLHEAAAPTLMEGLRVDGEEKTQERKGAT